MDNLDTSLLAVTAVNHIQPTLRRVCPVIQVMQVTEVCHADTDDDTACGIHI